MALEQTFTDGLDDWYSLFVRTGLEHNIVRKLVNLRIESLQYHVPRREIKIRRGGSWHVEINPMFPGYILVHGQLTADSYNRIKQISDVYAWICNESGPRRISQNEIAILRKLLDSQDVIRMSKVLYEGDKVIVVEGPLIGNEAIIRKVDRRSGRVKISVGMFGNEKLVDISVDNVSGKTGWPATPDTSYHSCKYSCQAAD
jgi:transcriptional antiterminator NusG